MSSIEFNNSNEIDINKLLSIKPKLKLNRSIYNNNKKDKPILYNSNNIDKDTDLSSLISFESNSVQSIDDKSVNDEYTMNLSTFKNHELKCISEVSNLSIKGKQEPNKSQPQNLNKMNNIIQDLNQMDISDEETIPCFSEKISNDKFLPCRYEEQTEIYHYLKNGLETYGNYNSLYICGMTGTGKTESVNKVIEMIEEENELNDGIPFRSLFINCVNFDTNMKLIKCIYNFIFSKNAEKIKVSKYLNLLDNFFSERKKYNGSIYLNDPTNSHIILIIDELDYLINKSQILLYHIFNWSIYPYSKLIIITISNLINISDVFLPKILSRFGHNKLIFKPYKKEQIREILNYKGININLFNEDALKITSMKVAAINGDLRRVILILKHAMELYNNDVSNNLTKKQNNLIDKFYILKSCSDLFDSEIINTIKNLGIISKIVLGSILFNIIKQNKNSIQVEIIYYTVDLLLEKYNEYNKDNEKTELEINWDEFKKVIYDLNRIKIIQFTGNDNANFKDNFVLIKFYADEFSVACDSDDDFKPINIFLSNSVN